MDRGRRVAGQGDQAEARVVAAKPGDGGEAVEAWHVRIDDERVGTELLRELDGLEAVSCLTDHCEAGLCLDHPSQRLEVRLVVVGDDDPDHASRPDPCRRRGRRVQPLRRCRDHIVLLLVACRPDWFPR